MPSINDHLLALCQTFIRLLLLIGTLFMSTTITSPQTGVAQLTERDLLRDLLLDYDRRTRPVKNWSKAVNVTVQPQIYSLVNVNELYEQVTLLLWIPQSWYDEYLVWNETKYGGLKRINIPADQIWTPDGTIFNIVDAKETLSLSRIYARITSDGHVELDLNKLVDVRCPMDVRQFPFDVQSCVLQYGSWSFQYHQLTHHVKQTFVPTNNENSEWEIISFSGEKVKTAYESSTGDTYNEYEEILYTLMIRRKPLFYVVVLLIPTFLIVSVAIIGLFIAHSADGDREEKVSFGLTTLLTMAVVLDMVTGEMPKSSAGLPLLGRYVLFETIVSVTAMLISAAVLLCNEYVLTRGIPPPPWISHIFEANTKTYGSGCKKNGRLQYPAKEEKILDCNSELANQPLLRLSLSKAETVRNEMNELYELLRPISEFCLERKRAENQKNIWQRFFSLIDYTSMTALLILNTALTIFTFYDEIL